MKCVFKRMHSLLKGQLPLEIILPAFVFILDLKGKNQSEYFLILTE